MDINEKNIKKWSTVGARPTFGLALMDLAEEQENLMVLTADVSTSAGLDRYRKKWPDKYLDVGIAEQNMMAVATGLAKEGFSVVTTTFAPFQTMRCLEQIRVNQGYMQIPLVIVGLASGIYHCYLGNTHCCIEDVSIMRAIPNVSVMVPADGLSVVKIVKSAVDSEKTIYIRLTGGSNLPIIYHEDCEFYLGGSNMIQKGERVAILANGTMVNQALEAAKLLELIKIKPTIIDMYSVKPLDEERLDSLSGYELIVTIEEHSTVGGLGAAVAEYLIQKKNAPQMLMLGIRDFFPHASEYTDALEICGLQPGQIRDVIEEKLKEGKNESY